MTAFEKCQTSTPISNYLTQPTPRPHLHKDTCGTGWSVKRFIVCNFLIITSVTTSRPRPPPPPSPFFSQINQISLLPLGGQLTYETCRADVRWDSVGSASLLIVSHGHASHSGSSNKRAMVPWTCREKQMS